MPSSTKNLPVLKGDLLFRALAITTINVKWIRTGAAIQKISAPMALIIARAGVYEGKARQGRVFYIREIDQRSSAVCDTHYWDDRSVIKYHDDQTACVPKKVLNTRWAARWDHMAKSQPKSW